jgi:amino acid adenylation domain-containing protein
MSNTDPESMESMDDVEDILPLAPMQQGILVHQVMAPGSAAFHLQMELALDGSVDEARLEEAWRLIAARHSALRTSFVWERVEKPYQLVHREVALEVHRHDWRNLDRAEQERRRVKLLADERTRPFDLATPPLVRLATMVLDDRSMRLVWTFHHIVLEGWSSAIILGDLWKIYAGLVAGRKPDLPPPPSYANFLHWLEEQDLSEAEAFWKDYLKGFGAPVHLAIDRAADDAPPMGSRVMVCRRELSRELTTALQDFARTHRMTLNSVVQGAWSILLSRYSGEEDIVYGTAMSGRPPDVPDVESMVGLFANALPVRVQVPGDAELVPWLHELQLGQVNMRQYEYCSLMQVQNWVGRHGTPLFNSVLLFQNWLGEYPSGQITPHLHVSVVDGEQTGDQPLMLYVMTGETMRFELVYDPDRFERSAMERLLSHCESLLQGMISGALGRIRDIPMVSGAERQQILGAWQGPVVQLPADALMHSAFERQVDREPARRAIIAGRQVLQYGALEAAANRIAHVLRGRGIGRGDRVGLCVERNADMVAAVLGVLKAGACYVPLDPMFPKDRLRFMAEDAGLALLVSTAELAPLIGLARERCLLLDADAAVVAAAPESRLAPDARSAQPEDPAYTIYTSGSTGKPKGVVVPHRAVANFLASMADTPGLGPDDVLVAVTTLSFDIAVLELQLPLATGATVVIADREDATNGAALSDLLARHGATVLQATPATWEMLLGSGWVPRGGFRGLIGGEALPPALAAQLLSAGVELWNMYGPTETTVWSTCTRVTDAADIHIGCPIANTRVYVVDRHGQLCPVGLPGELCIGGAGVASGYLNRPELTAEKFVPDPFAGQPGTLMYRTGDLCAWREDGNLAHLGRLDFQVKIRGYRIELGEIEARLSGFPEVRQAVVIPREDTPGDKALVAYVVAEPGARIDVQAIRGRLRSDLPDYMIPRTAVVLAELPRLPNGKIDRKQLPPPAAVPRDEHEAAASAGHAAASSAGGTPELDGVGGQVAEVWKNLLGIDLIKPEDNFFDLGGHSLLAIRAVSEIESRTGVQVNVRQLIFESLAEIAASIEAAQQSGTPPKPAAKERRGFWRKLFAR